MSKLKIFDILIKAIQRKDGTFGNFNQLCKKDPEIFFKSKNVFDLYSSLDDEEKNIFKSEKRFFDLLVHCGIKTEENTKFNLYPFCKVCSKETEFKSIAYGYANSCCKKCAKLLRESTLLKKYGKKHISQTNLFKDKVSASWDQKTEKEINEITRKREETYESKTGYKNPTQNPKIQEQVVLSSKEKYNCSRPQQKHILNYDKLYDFDFIIENFSTKDKQIYRDQVLAFFNISAATWEKKIRPELLKCGYKTKGKYNVLELRVLSEIEKIYNISLKKQYKIKDFKVDGYDRKTKTVYEFLGDYWHGNPEKYDLDMINANTKTTFSELHKETFIRLREIKDLGFNVCFIWEKDYKEKGLEGIQTF